jgi:hypothetical protein
MRMKLKLTSFILLFITLIGCDGGRDGGHSDMGCKFEKTKKTKDTTFPFNEADKIVVYSYEPRESAQTHDTLIVNGKFMVKGIQEKIVLNAAQIDSLFSILYNHKITYYDRDGYAHGQCGYYNPHHAIVFFNKGKAIAYLEICFECGDYAHSRQVDFGEFCSEKYGQFECYFSWIGIKKFIEFSNINPAIGCGGTETKH